MTLHMVRGFVAPDSGMSEADVQAAIDDWVSKRTKWSEAEPTDVTRRTVGVDPVDGTGGTDAFVFTARFELSSDGKDNLLQKVSDKFKQKVAWFGLAYHECDHDAADRGGCVWGERWEWTDKNVTLPADVDDALPDSNTVTTVSA